MTLRGRIAAIDWAGDVRLIRLDVDVTFRFAAGQYLFIVHPSGRRIPFSVASSPRELPRLELHFRALAGNTEADLVNELLARQSFLELDGPYGNVRVDAPPDAPLVLIAGGTGISQARAILAFLSASPQRPPVLLVWSVVKEADLYCHAELAAIAGAWLRYVPVIDAPGDATNAGARYVERHANDLPTSGRVILCGGPGFVSSVTAALVAQGVARSRLEADMYSFGVTQGL